MRRIEQYRCDKERENEVGRQIESRRPGDERSNRSAQREERGIGNPHADRDGRQDRRSEKQPKDGFEDEQRSLLLFAKLRPDTHRGAGEPLPVLTHTARDRCRVRP